MAYRLLNFPLLRYGSVVALYSIDSLKTGTTPHRLFYSYERITCFDYSSATSCVVCGTAAGSLLLFDLRRVQTTADSKKNQYAKVAGFSGKGSSAKKSFSEQISEISQQQIDTLTVDGAAISFVEEPPAYSSDVFALTGTSNNLNLSGTATSEISMSIGGSEDENMLPPFLGEIADVAVMASSTQVVALDIQGLITSWRILQTDS